MCSLKISSYHYLPEELEYGWSCLGGNYRAHLEQRFQFTVYNF